MRNAEGMFFFGPNPTRAKNAWSSSTCLLYGCPHPLERSIYTMEHFFPLSVKLAPLSAPADLVYAKPFNCHTEGRRPQREERKEAIMAVLADKGMEV